MTYLISDIHGEYELLCRLLDKIKFSDSDKLYVLGDMIDKGDKSCHVLKLIFSLPNAECILGNHEYDFLKTYWALMRRRNDYGEVLKRLQSCFADGTLLDWETIDKIETLGCIVERENFIGVHAGMPVLPDGRLLSKEKVTVEQAVYDRNFKEPRVKVAPYEKCVIFGHTPVRYISDKDEFIFYPKEGISNSTKISDYSKIHIDTGVCLSGVLGCLCVETLREEYVKK